MKNKLLLLPLFLLAMSLGACGPSVSASSPAATSSKAGASSIPAESSEPAKTSESATPTQSPSVPVSRSEESSVHVHTPGAPVEERRVEPTCVDDGSVDKVVYCDECHEELSRETVALPALGHDLIHHDGKPATCTEDGYSEYDACSRCDYVSGKTVVPATGHIHTATREENRKEATCTEPGSYELVTYCLDDEVELSRKTVELPATGHTCENATYVWSEDNSSCAAKGKCKNCQAELSETVSALKQEGIATETEGGFVQFTATFEEPSFEAQIKTIGTSEPVGTYDKLAFTLDERHESYSVKAKSTNIADPVIVPATYKGLPVRSVAKSGFEKCASIKTVVLPESIEEIETYAFYDSSIQSISLPKNLKRLPNCAFASCDNLKTLSIPDSLESLGDGAVMAKEYTEYEGGRYLGNQSNPYLIFVKALNVLTIESCKIHEGCRFIADGAFSQTGKMTSLTIPDSVISIGSDAFRYAGFRTLSLPASLQTIPADAFAYAQKLEFNEYGGAKYLPIGDEPYAVLIGMVGEPTHVDVKEGCRLIAGSAFKNAAKLESISLPETLSSIGAYAFSGCSALSSLSLPESLETIESRAFQNCTSIKTLALPSKLKKLGEGAFVACKGLYSAKIPASIASFGKDAFASCGLTLVEIEEGLPALGDNAFGACNGLVSVKLPRSITKIPDRLFRSCNGLKTVDFLTDAITEIGARAFWSCENLSRIEIPDSVKVIHAYAFDGCVRLGGDLGWVEMSKGLETLGDYAFLNCPYLKGLYLPEGCKSVGRQAFKDCTRLVTLALPASLERLGYQALANCASLSYHEEGGLNYLGTSENPCAVLVKAIDYKTLQAAEIAEGCSLIYQGAFSSSKILKTVSVPDSVVFLGSGAFAGCEALEELVLPNTVRYVGENACGIPDYPFAKKDGDGYYVGSEENPRLVCVGFRTHSSVSSVAVAEGCKFLAVGLAESFYSFASRDYVVIPRSVESICDNAFEKAYSSTIVYYEGSIYDWYAIDIGETKNDVLRNEYRRYYYSEEKPSSNGKYWHYVDGVPAAWEAKA